MILLLLLAILGQLRGQNQPWNAVGLRFASYVNWFPRAEAHQLVTGAYTTGAFGVYFKRFSPTSGFEAGLNLNYKNGDDQGFPNLPVVMRDFSGENPQNVGLTAVEFDLKAGPRFGPIHPKIGYVWGFRFRNSGFFSDSTDRTVNRMYLLLPLGTSVDLPTRWGSVGFGGFFHIGILNVARRPTGFTGNWDGGRLRAVSLEVIVSYGNR